MCLSVARWKWSVEPQVQLQGYGYSLFCSHSSRCLQVLVWQYFEEALCALKVRLKWYGFKGFPSHSSHCGLFFGQFLAVPWASRSTAKVRTLDFFQVSTYKPHYIVTWATIYRSLQTLRCQKRKKVSKRVFLGVCKKSPPKHPKKNQNTQENLLILN